MIQRTVAINDFGLQERTRVSATGKESVRFTVSISSTKLIHDLNTKDLARGPAEAIAEHLRSRVATIQQEATPATVRRRVEAARAFAAGFANATKRYSGGRMGAMQPNQSTKLFNDSGRFAKGIVARNGNSDEWVINVPANRFDPSTLDGPEGRRGMAALQAIYAKLIQLVPEFADPAALMRVRSVAEAIVDAQKKIISRNTDLRSKLGRARLAAVRTVLGLVL